MLAECVVVDLFGSSAAAGARHSVWEFSNCLHNIIRPEVLYMYNYGADTRDEIVVLAIARAPACVCARVLKFHRRRITAQFNTI